MSIAFNNIPGTIVAPIMTFEVNSGGQFENRSRLLIVGAMNVSGGAMKYNVPTPCPSIAEAERLAGPGSMIHDAVVIARRNAPAQEIWVIAPDTSDGTAEVRTISITSDPSPGDAAVRINGETVYFTVQTGDDAADAATALVSAINGYFNALTGARLPVTAAVNTGDDTIVDITARWKGAEFSGVPVSVPEIAGGNVLSGKVTFATATAGAGVADTTATLAALGDEPFDGIVLGFSDAANVTRIKSFLSDVSGRWAWNRQIYGHALYGKFDSLANLTTHGLSHDDRHISVIPAIASSAPQQAPWMWAAGFAARAFVWLGDGATGNVSCNQTGLAVEGLLPPDRSGWLDYATRDAMLGSGLSTWSVSTGGAVQIDKIVTTARTLNGVPDTVFRDVQAMAQLMYGLRFMRAAVVYEHSQKAISDDNPEGLGSISTPRDIKATFVHAYEGLVARGVFENAEQFARDITVARDLDNPARVNVMAPIDRVNPLDIIATNAKIYAQFS